LRYGTVADDEEGNPSRWDEIADCGNGQNCCAVDADDAVIGSCCTETASATYLYAETPGTTVTVIGATGFQPTSSSITGFSTTSFNSYPGATPDTPDVPDRLGSERKATIALGSVVGLTIVGAASYFIWRVKKRCRLPQTLSTHVPEADSSQRYELDGATIAQELSAPSRWREAATE
jgi:hypothetical protein